MKQWVIAGAVLAVSLSACGGGGSGSGSPPAASPPPPPPPPAGNSAPSVVAVVDKTVVDEGQPFAIDASATTDADGDTIAFTIRQTSGPQMNLTSEGGGVFRYQTPYVAADTPLSFEVTATDGEDASTILVDVAISNYARLPLSTQWGAELSRASMDGSVRAIGVDSFPDPVTLNERLLVVSENAGGSLDIHRLTPAANGSLSVPSPTLTLAPDEQAGPAKIVFADFNLDTRMEFAVLSVTDSQVTAFRVEDGASGNDVVAESGSAVVPGACALAAIRVGDDRPLASVGEYPGILVGTEGNGLTAMLNDGNPRDIGLPTSGAGEFSRTQSLATSGTACGFTAQSDLNGQGGYEIYAYDPVRQELVGYAEPVTTAATQTGTIAIQLPAPGMALVDIDVGIGSAGQELVAAVFSDGRHDGNHALLIFQNDGGMITQTTVTLPNGVPSDLAFASIDDGLSNDYDSDVVITVPETPYLYVFENLSSASVPGVVEFSDVAYFEVGFGAHVVAISEVDDTFGEDLVVGTDNGEVILFNQR